MPTRLAVTRVTVRYRETVSLSLLSMSLEIVRQTDVRLEFGRQGILSGSLLRASAVGWCTSAWDAFLQRLLVGIDQDSSILCMPSRIIYGLRHRLTTASCEFLPCTNALVRYAAVTT